MFVATYHNPRVVFLPVKVLFFCNELLLRFNFRNLFESK
jgi:hypothetical protein